MQDCTVRKKSTLSDDSVSHIFQFMQESKSMSSIQSFYNRFANGYFTH